MRAVQFIAILLLSIPVWAQKKAAPAPVNKQPLTHGVYDNWREIPFKQLTPDGAVAVMAVNPQDGDGKVIFYHLKTNAQDSVKRAAEIGLGYDSRQVIFKIKPQQKVVDRKSTRLNSSH